MSKELTSFHRLYDLNQQNYVAELDKIRKVGDNFIVKLHKCCFIDDDLLKHNSGIKKYVTAYKRISNPEQRGNYRKIPGPIAKHFACNQPAYAYPLFKTHKISPNDLQDISVFDIPVRLLQSAGFITTSRLIWNFYYNLSAKHFVNMNLMNFAAIASSTWKSYKLGNSALFLLQRVPTIKTFTL